MKTKVSSYTIFEVGCWKKKKKEEDGEVGSSAVFRWWLPPYIVATLGVVLGTEMLEEQV